MKVLNIVKYYHPSTGGMETYVRQLSRGLGGRGIEASVLTIDHLASRRTVEDQVDGVAVRRIACQVKLMSQPVSWTFGREVKRLVAETDLVHLHCPFPNAEILGNSFATKPLIITWCADPANTRWKKVFPLFRPHVVRVLAMARRIALIGPSLLENSPTLLPFKDKCEVIPLAYSARNEVKAVARRLGGNGVTILFVGKLRKYKGVEYLLRSAASLPEVKLRIVGDGEERTRLEQLSEKLGIRTRTTFLGNISAEGLDVEYREAGLFVLPSIDASEAFGIVQAEAMSFGLPVINTNLASSVPFVSLDGVSGLTVPPCDPAALTAAIQRLGTDAGFYERCSRNALERAKLFSEEKLVESYAEIYRKYG